MATPRDPHHPSGDYGTRWAWDEVRWGTHCIDCYPGGCTYRVYVRDGQVRHEEVGGTFGQIAAGVPDHNPMGCNKGAAWSRQLSNPDRVTHPMRRRGPRGSGEWESISWDGAYTLWADAVLDAVEDGGIDTVIHEGTPEKSAVMPSLRFMQTLGGTVLDMLGTTNDFNVGVHITFGKFNITPSMQDWFNSELALVWFLNPSFTRIPHAHYISEARYHGTEIVQISPDYNASAMHADMFVPIETGHDADLALAMCQVILDENLFDHDFVTSQTDLPLVVRTDTGRFLREADLEEGGRGDRFFHLTDDGIQPASPENLTLDTTPLLEGAARVVLADGTATDVTTVFALLRSHLDDNSRPEDAGPRCSVHPDVIRELARKIAARKTSILFGAAASKFYHGDLIERSLCLLLALSGNWGKRGTGLSTWDAGMFDGQAALTTMAAPGIAGAKMVFDVFGALAAGARSADPSLLEEESCRAFLRMGPNLPPFLLWYDHAGYRDRWSNAAWHDPSMPRPFDEYVTEARAAGWWPGTDRLPPDRPPRVLVECGGNTLRRTRGGRRMLLEHLWPKLAFVVTIDHRISATAANADLVLPAAQHYEKCDYHIPSPFTMQLAYSDRAQPPAGEARNEWDIYSGFLSVLAQRAQERGLDSYTDGRGMRRRFADLWKSFTVDGHLCDEETRADNLARASALTGSIPEDTGLPEMRARGYAQLTGWGALPYGLGEASPFPVDETHSPLRNHVEKGLPYPTLTRRAQIYIDHPWFLEAGEALPCHKDPPAMGGNHPLRLTSGHCRWSIHRMNIAHRDLLQTHRGEPHAAINPADAVERGIHDHDWVEVFNDAGAFTVRAKVSPSVRPGQLIVYNGWESHQFPGWDAPNDVTPGMVKWLHLAGGYGHLDYVMWSWQPALVDRATRVDVRAKSREGAIAD